MKVLITGASGLIGSALIEKLKDQVATLFCQSRKSHQNEAEIIWVHHDLVKDNWEDCSIPDIDVVFHLAGQTSVYSAQEDPLNDLTVNVFGLLHLLEYLKKQSPPPFVVMAGTVTQVGLSNTLPIDEGISDEPITFYDISKLTAEKYLMQYIREGWIKGCSLRLANVFGRSQLGQHCERGVLDKVFNKAISGQDITIYGEGNYLRDYIFIDDVVSAFIAAAENIEQTNGKIFCIGSGQAITLKDAFTKVISLAETITGKRVKCKSVTPPDELSSIEYRNAVIDSSFFKKSTGWAPEYNFESGLNVAYRSSIPVSS